MTRVNNERKITIPPDTAPPTAAFFENENPAEAALLDIQIENAKYIWKAIIQREDFRASKFVLSDGKTIILSPSTREGVDWQLSYIASDNIPTMHGNYMEDNHYKPTKGHSMDELYWELAKNNATEQIQVKLLLDNNIKIGEQIVDEKNFLFIADMAKLYAIYNRVPINPESDFFKAFENINGVVDRAKYQQILTDSIITGNQPPKIAILQAQEKDLNFNSWDTIDTNKVKSENYEIVYVSSEMSETTPDEIYNKFNEQGLDQAIIME